MSSSVDAAALAAARNRVRELETRLRHQITLGKVAFSAVRDASRELETARILSVNCADAVEAAQNQRDEAIERARKAEAALYAAQRAVPQNATDAMTSAPHRFVTGDSTLSALAREKNDLRLRDLRARYNAMLNEKRNVELKYLELDRKWTCLKAQLDIDEIDRNPTAKGEGRKLATHISHSVKSKVAHTVQATRTRVDEWTHSQPSKTTAEKVGSMTSNDLMPLERGAGNCPGTDECQTQKHTSRSLSTSPGPPPRIKPHASGMDDSELRSDGSMAHATGTRSEKSAVNVRATSLQRCVHCSCTRRILMV